MEQWVKMQDAAKETGLSLSKLSRLAKKGKLQTHSDVLDERVTLVNLAEVKALIARSRLQKQEPYDYPDSAPGDIANINRREE